jgi:hypothetical protein
MNRIEALDHIEEVTPDPEAINSKLLATTAFGRKTLQILAEACELRYVKFKNVKQCLKAYERSLDEGICRGKSTAVLVAALSNNDSLLEVDQICFQILHELSIDLEKAISNNKVKQMVKKNFIKYHEQVLAKLERTRDPKKIAELWKEKLSERRSHMRYSKYVREDGDDLYSRGVSSIPSELKKPFQTFSNKIQKTVRTEILRRTKHEYAGTQDAASTRVIRRLASICKSIKKPHSFLIHMNPREDDTSSRPKVGHSILAIFSPKNETSFLFDSNYGLMRYRDAASVLTILDEDYAQEMASGVFTLEAYRAK